MYDKPTDTEEKQMAPSSTAILNIIIMCNYIIITTRIKMRRETRKIKNEGHERKMLFISSYFYNPLGLFTPGTETSAERTTLN